MILNYFILWYNIHMDPFIGEDAITLPNDGAHQRATFQALRLLDNLYGENTADILSIVDPLTPEGEANRAANNLPGALNMSVHVEEDRFDYLSRAEDLASAFQLGYRDAFAFGQRRNPDRVLSQPIISTYQVYGTPSLPLIHIRMPDAASNQPVILFNEDTWWQITKEVNDARDIGPSSNQPQGYRSDLLPLTHEIASSIKPEAAAYLEGLRVCDYAVRLQLGQTLPPFEEDTDWLRTAAWAMSTAGNNQLGRELVQLWRASLEIRKSSENANQ